MSANAQANLVHDFESPLQCKAEHVAVILVKYTQNLVETSMSR